jgi:hypothetical protein
MLHYPSIILADVYAALTYYHDHLEEIRQQIREDEALRQLQTQIPSLVQQKLGRYDVGNNRVSLLSLK